MVQVEINWRDLIPEKQQEILDICKEEREWGLAPLAILEIEEDSDDPILDIQTNIFDKEDNYPDCTVQILTNSITGEISVGWFENKNQNYIFENS